MARPDKAAKVAELKDLFSSSGAVVLTEYRGLTVKQTKALRRQLGDDATYAVAKNTLALIAARGAGIDGLDDQLTGPTALAFINGDVATVAKGLRDFAKANPLLVIKGGVLEGKILDANAVKKLADLESREVLLAKMAGAMKGNLQQAVYLFAAPLAQAARALGALQDAAAADPSIIGGAGVAAPAVDQEHTEAPADAEATEAPADAEATEAPADAEATEEVPADAEATESEAEAADAPSEADATDITDAAAAAEATTDAADAASTE